MKRVAWLLAFGVLILLVYVWQAADGRQANDRGYRIEDTSSRPQAGGNNDPATADDRGGFNRKASSLIYSKHARCRMECRHISENEVLEILRTGRINYSKSDMRGQPDPKYALEGLTRDGQEVRIIFANSPRGIVVVTVIDLENEWKCNCK